ncbi:hypothetical protein KSC_054210 [Ktedonobacter sp. SOSP1-52]|nr:hypothetical protein KSC_054210 [Ktedonobacter sp. SOSP1-52]
MAPGSRRLPGAITLLILKRAPQARGVTRTSKKKKEVVQKKTLLHYLLLVYAVHVIELALL